MTRSLPFRIVVGLAVATGMAIGVLAPHLAVWAEALLEWVDGLGPLGPVAMIGGFILVCIFSMPGAPLTLGAGFLFGVVKGTVVVTIGATLGAAVAFLIGRTLARKVVRAKVGKRKRFRRLDRAVRHHSFVMVLLTRISPVFPFNLLNYVYSLTSVPFRHYIAATFIGVIPVSILYVYVGSLMKTLAHIATGRVDRDAIQPWVVFMGLALTVGAVVLLAHVAKKMIARVMAEDRKARLASDETERRGRAAEELGEDLILSSMATPSVDPTGQEEEWEQKGNQAAQGD